MATCVGCSTHDKSSPTSYAHRTAAKAMAIRPPVLASDATEATTDTMSMVTRRTLDMFRLVVGVGGAGLVSGTSDVVRVFTGRRTFSDMAFKFFSNVNCLRKSDTLRISVDSPFDDVMHCFKEELMIRTDKKVWLDGGIARPWNL